MGIPDHLNCLLSNLYAGQEAAIRTRHGTKTGSKLGTEYSQGCILSLCLFDLIQNISCKIRGWMNHKLESSFLEAQKQKYRPMEHDKKPRDKPMHLLVPYFWQRRQEYTMGQRQPLQ